MGLFKKLGPILQGTIAVTSTPGQMQAGALVRQALILGGGVLVSKGYMSNDDVPVAAGALVALGSIVVGQLKTRKERAEKIVLAEAAPNGVASDKALNAVGR